MEHYSNVVKAMIARSNARAADIADKIQARAYYQFQYVPPAGPLPGWSMEQQTEDAINEIGNIAYSSDEIAREAREIAQQAYNAAQAAIEMATNALTAAQNAQQTADTALNTANTAVTKADNAQASADAAQKAADAAQKSANDAQTSADNAQSTANTAIENASQALSAANEAKASADQSNQRLDVLEPIVDTLRWYENVTDNIDFNTHVELERAFLQGTANTNGPIPGPGWLDVDDDYNETYIRQKFIAQADGACYVRFGTIVPDSSPIEVSSWTGWVKYALASELTSAVETINTSITSINGEITTIKSDITSIEGDITELQGSLGNAEGDITAVTNALDAHKADYDNPHKVTAAQLGLATVYKYKGSVETYANLPTSGQQVGDVYNVKQADPDHNIEAGDNVAWDGEKWDILAGDTDLSGYAQLNSANTFTALNTFRANIRVSNGTAAGSQGQVIFGVKPSTATVQANIIASTTGAMNYTATEGQAHYFNVGATEVATIGGTATTATLDFLANNILKYSTSSGLRVGGGGTSKIIGFYPEAADNTAGMRLSNQAEAISTDYSIFSLQNNSAISYTKNAALQVGNFKILEVDRNNNNVTIKADSNGQILFTPNNLASNTSSIDSDGNFYISQSLTVGSSLNTGVFNGVIRAGNNERCLYFAGTAENTHFVAPNTGDTVDYQAGANCYLINCSINNPSSLKMNFSHMNFTTSFTDYLHMCKTLTIWLPVGATVPAVTWTFPTGSVVYYPKGVAPTLTANANNIINVIAIVNYTGKFSIQVCDTVVLPYSG